MKRRKLNNQKHTPLLGEGGGMPKMSGFPNNKRMNSPEMDKRLFILLIP